MLKKLSLMTVFVGFMIFLVACNDDSADSKDLSDTSSNENTVITISGSTSVGPLTEKLAASFEERENVKIEINQIGSSAGITNAISGVSKIGMSSHDFKKEELDQGIEQLVIAHDGIVVVAHPSNRVKDLTVDQVKEIFTGKVSNWKDIGGEDKEIVVVSREEGSGSRDAFQEIVGYESGELTPNAVIANGNGNIKTTVATNENAVGFISFEYMDDTVSALKYNGVEPTAANVLAGKYKLSRPFLFVYKDGVSDAAQKFMDFIVSADGQKIVEEAGAIPLDK